MTRLRGLCGKADQGRVQDGGFLESKLGGHFKNPSKHTGNIPKQILGSCTSPQGSPHTLLYSRYPLASTARTFSDSETDQLRDISFSFNRETKEKKKDAEESV